MQSRLVDPAVDGLGGAGGALIRLSRDPGERAPKGARCAVPEPSRPLGNDDHRSNETEQPSARSPVDDARAAAGLVAPLTGELEARVHGRRIDHPSTSGAEGTVP